jgi:pimeloyl-ACP methyl ester carboxylesterase
MMKRIAEASRMETSLYIEREGEGPVMLFIHGSGCSCRMWERQKEYLYPSMEVVLVDLPGHGSSSGDGCDSVKEYADAIYGSMERLYPQGYYVAGHSLGGAIAMSLALHYPSVIEGVVLIGTGARLRVLPSIIEGLLKEKERTLEDINSLSFSRGAPKELRAEALGMMMGCRAEIIRKDFVACDCFDIIGSVGSIEMPVLILCGEEDALTPIKYSQFLNENISGSRLVLMEGAGHMAMIEKPDEVSKAIELFVKNRPSA